MSYEQRPACPNGLDNFTSCFPPIELGAVHPPEIRFRLPMDTKSVPHLRVLVSDGPGVRLDEVTNTVAGLGHAVTARESLLPNVDITPVERPDVPW